MKMQGTLGIVLSISLATTVLAAVIAVIVIKCYLNWKRQHKKELRLAEGAVHQLVLSSQPVDFIPLLLQDRLEEEEEDDLFDSAFMNCNVSGTSTEDVSDQTKNQATRKEPKIHPPLQRLNSASCVLDRYGQRVTVLSKPQRTNRGESLFFDEGDESLARRCFSAASSYSRPRKDSIGLRSRSESANSLSRESLDGDATKRESPEKSGLKADESLSRRCYSAASSYSRPRAGSIGLRTRSESVNSLSRESLDGDSTLPDPMPHMRKSVVSTVDTNAPRPKIEKQRRHSTSKMTYANKPARKKSLAPQKHGNVIFKMTYQADQHKLEVHLINATELPIRHGRLLDGFARISFKSPSKHQRLQSKVHKKTCNPIFDEKFVFENVNFSELQQSHLKIKLLDRLGVSRCEPVGEALIALSDETMTYGENVTRDLVEKAGRKQCAGELQVSLCHEATSSHLKVTIMKLKDLPKSMKSPSVAVELTHKGEILQKHQTKTKKKNLIFNEEFSFEVATNSSCTLENFGVQFTVFHHDFIRGNEVLGHVRLGMDAPLQSEVVHWKAVVLSPHKPIAEWHKLHLSLL